MPARNGTRVFIGNIPNDCRDRDLERFFEKYGRIRDIYIKPGRYAFAEFDDYRDAEDAVYDLNGKDFLGERVSVEHAKGPGRGRGGSRDRGSRRADWVEKYGPPTRTDYRIIVENLSTRVSWQDLKDLMRKAGDVTYANAHNDRRNEGIVEFASRSDMNRAIDKFDDYELQGRRLKLVKDGDDSRSRSRSRSKSRSRGRDSRSRSRSRGRRDSRSRSRGRRDSRSRSRGRSGRRDSKSPRRDEKSRSRSRSRDRRRSGDDDKDKKDRSRSRDRSSRDRSKDRSSRDRSRDRSRSRSRSRD